MQIDIRPEILDELIKGYQNPEDLIGENGLLKQLTKALLERAMNAELTHQLGYQKGEKTTDKPTANRRNGTSAKIVASKNGEMQIAVPRDRAGEFEPNIIKKHQRRFDGFDDLILSLYSRGLSTREIQAHIEEIYGVEVSPELVSNVTEAVQEEVREWQQRTLEALYPIIYLDALRVKIRVDGRVQNRCIYIGIGVNLEGKKETLGLWSSENEGAKFWLSVLTELNNRGIKDVLIACVDGLKGFPEAIESVFPKTIVQICIVHQIRNSLAFASYQERKEIAADLKLIYAAATADEALLQLELFAEKWDSRYPLIVRSWRNNWARIEPMFSFPAEIRRAIYTTNVIESLNMSLRKVTKTRAVFPSDEAAFKLLWLGLRNIEKKWTMPIHNWKQALQQFAIIFEGRVPLAGVE